MRRLALWTAYALIGFIAVCYSLSFAADRTNRQSEVVSSGASVFWEWKEHWGTPGQTNVTYHDQYRVTRTSDNRVKVEILNRRQKTENEQLKQNLLIFTQHTDTYVVKYSLTLQQDGKWMSEPLQLPRRSSI